MVGRSMFQQQRSLDENIFANVTYKGDADMGGLHVLVDLVDVVALEEALSALPPTHYLPHHPANCGVAQLIQTSNHHTPFT